MHPMEGVVVTTAADHVSAGGHTTALTPRYSVAGVEPDPFKHATDASQCTHCGAQITVSREIYSEMMMS